MIRNALVFLSLSLVSPGAFAAAKSVSCTGTGEAISVDLNQRVITRNGQAFPFLRTDSFFGPIFKPYVEGDFSQRLNWTVRVLGQVTGDVKGTSSAEGALDVTLELEPTHQPLSCTITGD